MHNKEGTEAQHLLPFSFQKQVVKTNSVSLPAFGSTLNASSDIDQQIAQFIENYINLPSTIEWEDMKIICEVYKRPGNCPSVGVPSVPESLTTRDYKLKLLFLFVIAK